MKTVTTTIYKFKELTETAQQNAIEKNADINFSHGWWEPTYEDAENVEILIEGFDIDRGDYCQIEIKSSCYDTANLMVKDHGVKCETHITAYNFIQNWNNLVRKYSDGINTMKVTEENEYDFDNEADDLEEEFKKAIARNYLKILQKEYEYLTSEEAIIETIQANDYDFTESGDIY